MQANLAGLSLRHPTVDDIPALVSFANLIARLDANLQNVNSVEELRGYWQDPTLQPERDILLVVDAQDTIVASLSALLLPPYSHVYQEINVHPAYRGRGLEAFLLERAASHAQAHLHLAPTGDSVRIVHAIWSPQTWLHELLQAAGFQHIATVSQFERRLDSPPPVVEMPPGISMRPFDPAQHHESLHRTLREIHQDGAALPPLRGELPDLPYTDPQRVFTAVEGNAMVAVVIFGGDGSLMFVGERRNWRGSGAAEAAMAVAARTLYQFGTRRLFLQHHSPLDMHPQRPLLAAAGFVQKADALLFEKTIQEG